PRPRNGGQRQDPRVGRPPRPGPVTAAAERRSGPGRWKVVFELTTPSAVREQLRLLGGELVVRDRAAVVQRGELLERAVARVRGRLGGRAAPGAVVGRAQSRMD